MLFGRVTTFSLGFLGFAWCYFEPIPYVWNVQGYPTAILLVFGVLFTTDRFGEPSGSLKKQDNSDPSNSRPVPKMFLGGGYRKEIVGYPHSLFGGVVGLAHHSKQTFLGKAIGIFTLQPRALASSTMFLGLEGQLLIVRLGLEADKEQNQCHGDKVSRAESWRGTAVGGDGVGDKRWGDHEKKQEVLVEADETEVEEHPRDRAGQHG